MNNVFEMVAGAFLLIAAAMFPKKKVETEEISWGDPVETSEPLVVNLYTTDIHVMAQTIWGEARFEGYRGMQAVANVIMNRVKSTRWPSTPAAVCKQPYQFSVWNGNDPQLPLMQAVTADDARFKMALDIAFKAFYGELEDITNGSDHYLNVQATMQMRGGSLPSWVMNGRDKLQIGAHTFMKA